MQSFVTDSNIIHDTTLYGRWHTDTFNVTVEPFVSSQYRDTGFQYDRIKRPADSADRKLAWIAARTYMISLRNEGVVYTLEGQLATFNGRLFLQLHPYKVFENGEEVDLLNFILGYSVAEIIIKRNEARLEFPDEKKFKEMLLNERIGLRYEHEKLFDVFAITASSAELGLFLEKYTNDRSLFSSKNILNLSRHPCLPSKE